MASVLSSRVATTFTVLVRILLVARLHLTRAALKKDDIAQLKTKFGFNPEETFAVPKEISEYYAKLAEEGAKANAEWDSLFKSYQDKYPKDAAEFLRRTEGRLPEGWEKALPTYTTEDAAVGSRKLSETTLNALAAVLPELMGGS